MPPSSIFLRGQFLANEFCETAMRRIGCRRGEPGVGPMAGKSESFFLLSRKFQLGRQVNATEMSWFLLFVSEACKGSCRAKSDFLFLLGACSSPRVQLRDTPALIPAPFVQGRAGLGSSDEMR